MYASVCVCARARYIRIHFQSNVSISAKSQSHEYSLTHIEINVSPHEFISIYEEWMNDTRIQMRCDAMWCDMELENTSNAIHLIPTHRNTT